jgi:hypothetical protein
VDAGHRVVLVVLAGEKGGELQTLDVVLEPFQRFGELCLGFLVALVEELV